MMKKGKGVPHLGIDLRHQMLLQDYEQLAEEVTAKKIKLQKTIKKKRRLAAEVKFLREKYASFMNKSPQVPRKLPKKNAMSSTHLAQPQNSTKKQVKLSRFAPPQNSMNADEHSKSGLPRNSMHAINVYTYENNQRANEGNTTSMSSALFDLNKVSTTNDEETYGIQSTNEQICADQLNVDLHLSAYKDIGSSSNVGSRDNSWQTLKV